MKHHNTVSAPGDGIESISQLLTKALTSPDIPRIAHQQVKRPTELRGLDCADERDENLCDTDQCSPLIPYNTHYDRLLDWMSLVGNGSAVQLSRVARSLGVEDVARRPARWLRCLRLLGHVESSHDGDRWSMAPPVLIGTHSGEWILCGARDGLLKTALQIYAGVELTPQENAPSRWKVIIPDVSMLDTRLKSELPPYSRPRFVPNLGAELAQRLPIVEEWRDALPRRYGLTVYDYEARRWVNEQWVHLPNGEDGGFYEFWPRYQGSGLYGWEERGARPLFHAFYCSQTATWHDGSWYDLRFLGRLENGEECAVTYSRAKNKLAVPTTWRFPEPYERALVLCSGFLPRQLPSNEVMFLVYEAISPAVPDALSHLKFRCHS